MDQHALAPAPRTGGSCGEAMTPADRPDRGAPDSCSGRRLLPQPSRVNLQRRPTRGPRRADRRTGAIRSGDAHAGATSWSSRLQVRHTPHATRHDDDDDDEPVMNHTFFTFFSSLTHLHRGRHCPRGLPLAAPSTPTLRIRVTAASSCLSSPPSSARTGSWVRFRHTPSPPLLYHHRVLPCPSQSNLMEGGRVRGLGIGLAYAWAVSSCVPLAHASSAESKWWLEDNFREVRRNTTPPTLTSGAPPRHDPNQTAMDDAAAPLIASMPCWPRAVHRLTPHRPPSYDAGTTSERAHGLPVQRCSNLLHGASRYVQTTHRTASTPACPRSVPAHSTRAW